MDTKLTYNTNSNTGPVCGGRAIAYPNPFNPTTTISFGLPENINVIFKVYDINGRIIRNIIDNINMDSGYHSVIWNADSQNSGDYFVKLHAGSYVKTQKIMLLK